MIRGAACAVAVVLMVGLAFGEMTPERVKEAEGYIKAFASAEFRVREEATQKLIGMGPEVVELVKKVAGETTDAEVKTRCEMVLRSIEEKRATEGSRVSLSVKDAPLEDVLLDLSKQSGNKLITAEGREARGAKVTLEVKDKPFWEALDAVCEAAGAQYSVGSYSGRMKRIPVQAAGADEKAGQKQDEMEKWGLVLWARGKEAREIGGYAGPVVLKVDSVQRRNDVMERFRDGAGKTSERELVVTLTGYIEERLTVTEMSIRVNKALSADGKNLLGGGRAKREVYYGWRQQSWVAQGGASIEDTGQEIAGPLRLEGVVEVTYGVRTKELRVEDVFAAKGGEAKDGALGLSVTEATLDGDTAKVKLKMDLPGNGRDGNWTSGEGGAFGLFLEDPEGRRYSRGSRSMSMGGGAFGRSVEATIEYGDLPRIAGKWAVVYVYPEKEVKKEYPFVVEGVPVPSLARGAEE